MSNRQRFGDLEVNEDLTFQQWEWRLQRIGWVVMGVIILAGLVGVFGQGPLSKVTAGEPGTPLRVEYERFMRYQAPTQLRIHLGIRAAQDGKVRLQVSREYMENMQIEHITPEPQSVEMGPDDVYYLFSVTNSERPTTVTFNLIPQTPGWRAARVSLDEGQPIRLSALIYP
jgi:hypothetical protein